MAAALRCRRGPPVLAVLQAFTPRHHRLPRGTWLSPPASRLRPHVPIYRAVARDGAAVGDERGAYHLSARLISLARAAERPIDHRGRRPGDARPGQGVRRPVILVQLIAGVPCACTEWESRTTSARRSSRGSSCRSIVAPAARVLLAGLPAAAARDYLAPLAEADPQAAARLERIAEETADRGWAVSEEEIDRGVWAASAAVTDGRSTVAALTVPSPLVRSPPRSRNDFSTEMQGSPAGQ